MKAYNHALLIGNGETVPADFLQAQARTADFILATDGGADRALAAGVNVHAVIGDLDSVSPATRRRLRTARWIYVAQQENTDLEKALNWLCSQPCRRCTVCAITGGRLDFNLGNFLSLYPYTRKIELTVRGPGWALFPVSRTRTIPCKPGERVSLLPFKQSRAVSTTGLKYPLKNAFLPGKYPGRTLSNQTTGHRFTVSLASGFLWVYHEE